MTQMYWLASIHKILTPDDIGTTIFICHLKSVRWALTDNKVVYAFMLQDYQVLRLFNLEQWHKVNINMADCSRLTLVYWPV